MIRLRRVGRKPDPYIPTATMADIVFLLIIFFIVTYNIEVDKSKVQLPRTTVRTDVPREAAYVSVDMEGVIRVSEGKETSVPVSSIEEVQTFAQNAIAKNPEKEFVVKADKETRYQVIDKILDALKQARAKTIFLLSEQRTVSETR
ncbi:MAG: ExbD/TolR family protein [Thermoanaerobaculaceae bacterium]